MAGFAIEVGNFADEFEGLADKIMRKIGFDLYARIVKRTRVKTGLARGNWLMGNGYAPNGPIERKRKAVDRSIPLLALEDYSALKERSIFIVNHVFYVVYLEYGTDRWEGDFMVKRTVEEFLEIARQSMR